MTDDFFWDLYASYASSEQNHQYLYTIQNTHQTGMYSRFTEAIGLLILYRRQNSLHYALPSQI